MNIFDKQNLSKLRSIFVINKDQADNHLDDLTNYINSLYGENQRLQKKVYEWSQDEEIQKLKNEINELQNKNYYKSNYSISEEELSECRKWEEKHLKKHKNESFGCIGGNFSYSLTPTSIGFSGVVKCSCGEEFEFRELG